MVATTKHALAVQLPTGVPASCSPLLVSCVALRLPLSPLRIQAASPRVQQPARCCAPASPASRCMSSGGRESSALSKAAAGAPVAATASPAAEAPSPLAAAAAAGNGSAPKRVSFDLAPSSTLGESLLAGSFTDFHPAPSALAVATGTEVALSPMSDKRLLPAGSPHGVSYSALTAQSEDDDDMPPPLEEVHTNNSSGHGHSHGGRNHSASSCSGSGHGHSSSSSSSSRGSASPGTPKRSPGQNCGGMKSRAAQKTAKSEEANRKARRQLGWASVFCLVFMVCEIIGGLIANSLAIMTDAAHLLSDLAGFLISIFALWLATRPATSRLSFGFHRAEILGALISVLLIWVLTGILVYEACWRLAHPEDVDGKIMFIVATAGLVCNFVMGMILLQSGHGHSHGGLPGSDHGHSHGPLKQKKPKRSGDHSLLANEADDHDHAHGDGNHGHSHGSGSSDEYKGLDSEHGHSHNNASHGHSHGHDDEDDDHPEVENLNVKAAFIHVVGDAIQSFGVMIAAAFIWYEPEWRIADPLCTFLFSILVLFTTTRLIKQSVAVLMEGVPEGLDPDEVEQALMDVPGVLAVHDLHIWSLSVGKPSLSVHLYCRDDAAHVLAAANRMCAKKYNIHHSTIQVERAHDDIECNDAFGSNVHSLDRIAAQNFGELGIPVDPDI